MISEHSGAALSEGPYFPQSALQGFHPRRASVSEERQRWLRALWLRAGGAVAWLPPLPTGCPGSQVFAAALSSGKDLLLANGRQGLVLQ